MSRTDDGPGCRWLLTLCCLVLLAGCVRENPVLMEDLAGNDPQHAVVSEILDSSDGQGAMFVVINSEAAEPLWFVDTAGSRIPLRHPPYTAYRVEHLLVSPDKRYLACLSVGEGHPEVAVFSLPDVLKERSPRALRRVDPWPGTVKMAGWRGARLVLRSDRPLHRDCAWRLDADDHAVPPGCYLLDVTTGAITPLPDEP